MYDDDGGWHSDMELHDIGWAVRKLNLGERVYRKGWNGRGMWLQLAKPLTFGNDKVMLPYIFIKTAQDATVPWTCSQTDLLAEDWELFRD